MQTSGEPHANLEQTSSVPHANGKQTLSKPQANRKQASRKQRANHDWSHKVSRTETAWTTIKRCWQTISNFRALCCKYNHRVWLCLCMLAASGPFDAPQTSCYGLCPQMLQLKLYLEHAHCSKSRPHPPAHL